jgi:predicted Fe-Mo cluster-binding NifX family protein
MPMIDPKRIAVPLADGAFCPHFGGAEAFALFTVDEARGTIDAPIVLTPPPHERGAFPMWLRAQGVSAVLAGGMGPRAVQILERVGIEAVLGIEAGEPQQLVRAYIDGTLVASGKGCGGGGLHDCHDHRE